MLPDYPEAKRVLYEASMRTAACVAENQEKHEFMRNFPLAHEMHEGSDSIMHAINNALSPKGMAKLSFSVSASTREMENWSAKEALDFLVEMHSKMIGEKTKLFFTRMNEYTEESGQVVDGAGLPLEEVMLRSIEKIGVDFSEDGQPIMPSFVVGKGTLKQQMMDLENSPDFKRKFNDIITRKYDEWRDREADRKLAD